MTAEPADAARIRQLWAQQGTRLLPGQVLTMWDVTTDERMIPGREKRFPWESVKTRSYAARTVTDETGTYHEISCDGVTVQRLEVRRNH